MKSADQLMSDIQLSLQALFQKIQPEMLDSMEKQGITPAQLFVLASLKKNGSLKISEIAERMEVKPSAVTLMADRLEQKNLIVRKHNTQDRRVINISLTDEGDRKFEDVLAGRKAIMARYLSYLTEEELLQAAHMTKKLAQAAAETNEK
ncbi:MULTISPECIES: MarR family transcriptional regulator [Bacillus]|uniref:MarR family transcriptional regulator n=1 Tax=Bacillus halotolerans TaxID=260554 RepID=A0A9Q4EML2_9BACI|nr:MULTISPECIES: MarR family transcriptional regulator [Bacillus]AZV50152.1 MarR family transcriptional regulator [Bacillus halotolerans]MBU5244262.1 MarR family transcriptional regulator [Bacillus halotolerans]MCP9297441.1 MarR family transcriptional regulator [Bacillus halotolerans]MCV0026007.1 MarR family transcriptional regulator [Bacillus sp. XT-2]MCY9187052.1 MarR family transcriptional regulator [Bacillus halotolerans]